MVKKKYDPRPRSLPRSSLNMELRRHVKQMKEKLEDIDVILQRNHAGEAPISDKAVYEYCAREHVPELLIALGQFSNLLREELQKNEKKQQERFKGLIDLVQTM